MNGVERGDKKFKVQSEKLKVVEGGENRMINALKK